MIGCKYPVPKIQDKGLPEGEWYCENRDCAVREVIIRGKEYGDDMPKMPARMFCPACKNQLKFHHWIGHTTLVPEKAVPGSGV